MPPQTPPPTSERPGPATAGIPAVLAWLALIAVFAAPAAVAQGDPNACDEPGEAPDVIVGDLHQIMRHGSLNGVTAFSLGTTSCNIGTCWLNWFDETPDHPVIGQNAFRLQDGRFEQIGQSWLKHGFFAVSGSLCFDDCQTTNGDHLGVHCSDPYSAFFNGWQTQLGPKSEVNPTTGEFPYPYGTQGMTGDAVYKRLQIQDEDIDPDLNPDARYFIEGQYITRDDAAAGRDANNQSHREVLVVGGGALIDIVLSDDLLTVSGPAIQAWSDADPTVRWVTIDSPGDGRYVAASKVTDLGDGRYGYEYAIQNVNSARAAKTLSIPLPFGALVSESGFHDVDYHSGEPYSDADWPGVVTDGPGPNAIAWSTESAEENPDANALRWGTLYNFRFEVDAPPADGNLSLELFDPPGTTLSFVLPAPAVCDNDGICEPGEECSGCPADCGAPGAMCCGDGQCVAGEDSCTCGADCGDPPETEAACADGVDEDCDGLMDCADPDCCGDSVCDDGVDLDGDTYAGCDCDDGNSAVWNAPGEVQDLALDGDPSGTALSWNPPADLGGATVAYDTIRSPRAGDFMKNAICVASDGMVPESLDDGPLPAEGAVYFYLIRAVNDCPDGGGSLGKSSGNLQRVARPCP